MLGEYLEENCPDVSVQVVIKSNEDWGEYIDSVSAAINPYIRVIPNNRYLSLGLPVVWILRALLSVHLHARG